MRVCFFSFSLLFLLSLVSCSASVKFGLRGQAAVNLFAEWKPDTQYTSKLYYTFCANIPQSARVMLGNIAKVRFIHYTDYATTSVKYDQIHPLPDTQIDSATGCMKGSLVIHQPFEPKTVKDSFMLLLLTAKQDQQTNDHDVKYHLFDV